MEWNIGGGSLKSKRGQFGQHDMRIGSCKYNGESCLTGAITGELYVWSGTSIKNIKKLHEKPIDAIFCNS